MIPYRFVIIVMSDLLWIVIL